MKSVDISYRKLLRHKAIGLAYTSEGKIEIDSRLKGKELLYVLIHELTHMYFPDMSEDDVIELSEFFCHYIHKENFRRVDNAE